MIDVGHSHCGSQLGLVIVTNKTGILHLCSLQSSDTIGKFFERAGLVGENKPLTNAFHGCAV